MSKQPKLDAAGVLRDTIRDILQPTAKILEEAPRKHQGDDEAGIPETVDSPEGQVQIGFSLTLVRKMRSAVHRALLLNAMVRAPASLERCDRCEGKAVVHLVDVHEEDPERLVSAAEKSDRVPWRTRRICQPCIAEIGPTRPDEGGPDTEEHHRPGNPTDRG